MKKSTLATVVALSFAITATSFNVIANEVNEQDIAITTASSEGVDEQKVNYGDPTASYRGLGIQRSNDYTQLSGVFGAGEHIASFDAGLGDNGSNYNYRGRYFNVDQDSGFGWSIDLLGSRDKTDTGETSNTALLGGLVQKFELTPNVMLVPMLAAGKSWLKTEQKRNNQNIKSEQDSWIAQPGVYLMYGFDAGHWLYANPKATYINETKKWTQELEVGGGYMVTDSSSLGFKYEVSKYRGHTDSKGWVNYYLYF